MTYRPKEEEYSYRLHDISEFSSKDPRSIVKGSKEVKLSPNIAKELNYARALNGSPHKLIKVE